MDYDPPVIQLARRITQHSYFDELVLGVILVNALALGIEATPELAELYEEPLAGIFALSQVFFVAEIALRILAHGRRPLEFFRGGWNVFDFTLVVLSLLPAIGGFTLTARLLRALRVLRVVSTRDTLRGFVTGNRVGLAALPALLALGAVAAYLFALAGYYLFGEHTPDSWGSLAAAFGSLGRLVSFQGEVPAPFAVGVAFVGLVALTTALLALAALRALAAPRRSPAGGRP